MKKLLLVIASLMCVMTSNALDDMTRVMVISDPHMLVVGNAEALAANKGGKLDKMSPSIFAKAVEIVVQARPEALLVCGDMTFNGEASGHAEMAAALAAIEAKGIPVLVIPGNHDILNPFSEDAEHENVTPKQFKKLYGAFGMGEDNDLENVDHDAKSMSWAGSLKGTNLGIIGLDANIYGTKSEYYSDGCIRQSTVDWMKAQASSLQSKGKMVVCMVHQQLVEHVPGQSILVPTTLVNNKHTKYPADDEEEEEVTLTDLLKAFADAQIHYVLTGHFHIHHMQSKTVKNSSGEDFTLTELTTGGLSTYPNWMRTLVFDTKKGQLASSTSTMVQSKVDGYDLQAVSRDELTAWANANYGATVASVITAMNCTVDKYEIYDGTTQFQLEESAYPEVVYTRNFSSNNWQPLYVPFDMQYNDWNGVCEVAKFQSVNGETVFFTLLKEGEKLEKNTPALIRLKDGLATGRYSITSSVKTSDQSSVMPVDGQSISQPEITLHGTYEGLTGDYMSQNKYFTLSSGKLTAVDGVDFLLPQRWYLTEANGDDTRVFTLSLNDAAIPVVKSENFGLKAKFLIDGQLVIVKDSKMFNIKGQEIK